MSFAGNLEDLAIVDVIQLLHSTRKSGTLCVTSGKGRSQIVFSNGFIVSANHCDGSIRIGKILVEMGVISEDVLNQTLDEQKSQQGHRQPLIGMLIEKKSIEKDVAYKGLECLIEMTIVEMVSWQKGTFTLDVDVIEINDEYKYIPDNLQQELNFDTQMVLLDALRIYDEKRAAGYTPADFSDANTVTQTEPERSSSGRGYLDPDQVLSADILGLGSIDDIEMPIPEVFTSLEAFDPSEIHRQKVRELLPEFPALQREELVNYLTEKTNIIEHHETGDQEQQAIILYGADELIRHGLMSACKYEGIMVFTASTLANLENMIAQNLDRSLTPVLVFDCPVATQEGFTKDEITGVRQQIASLFPQLQTVQIASPIDYVYSLQALTSGASAVVPRSIAENRRDSFINDFMQFLDSFPQFIKGLCKHQSHPNRQSSAILNQLRNMDSAAQIAFFLLEHTSQFFERSLTFVLHKGELVAERSFGIEKEKAAGPSAPLRFTVKVTPESLLNKVISDGLLFFSSVDDQTIRESIFGEISAPDKSKILLLPLVAGNRTLGLIYADFGQAKVKPIDCGYLESLAWVAGLALDKLIRSKH